MFQVYMISCKDYNVNEFYIGSTCNLKKRIKNHKSNCYNENSKKYNYEVYRYIRENCGFQNFEFNVLYTGLHISANRTVQKENDFIKDYRPTLNSYAAYQSKEELKEHKNKYYQENMEYIKEYNKEYYQRPEVKEHKKVYNQENKEYKKAYDALPEVKERKKQLQRERRAAAKLAKLKLYPQ